MLSLWGFYMSSSDNVYSVIHALCDVHLYNVVCEKGSFIRIAFNIQRQRFAELFYGNLGCA